MSWLTSFIVIYIINSLSLSMLSFNMSFIKMERLKDLAKALFSIKKKIHFKETIGAWMTPYCEELHVHNPYIYRFDLDIMIL